VTKRFDELWQLSTVDLNSKVQERTELMTAYGLMQTLQARSYLEIGASMGGSMVVLGANCTKVVAVDLFEQHSAPTLHLAMKMISAPHVVGVAGDSRDPKTIAKVVAHGPYDVVLIDGGHDYRTVQSDWKTYGPLATKAVFFHDIAQPYVKILWNEIGGGLEIKSPRTTMGFGVRFV